LWYNVKSKFLAQSYDNEVYIIMDKNVHNEEIYKKRKKKSSGALKNKEGRSEIKKSGSNYPKKRKKNKLAGKIVTASIITFLMIFAAFAGVYVAKLYVTPYTSYISEFEEGTLDSVQIAKEKCNILIMGTDKEGLRTDVMMLAQIDPNAGTAVVMSIPRDTRVKYNGGYHKINEVHALGMRKGEHGGSEASIQMVRTLTGMPIHHFVKVNFTAFRDSIDALGGVDFEVPQRMKYTDPYQDLYIDLQPGMQHLDGDKAEQLVRFRRYKNGDLDRIKVQQDFLHALADQKLKFKYIGKIDDVYSIIVDNMESSMSPSNFVDCGRRLLAIGKDNIVTVTMPCTPQDIGGISYVIVDEDALQETVETSFGYDEDGNEI